MVGLVFYLEMHELCSSNEQITAREKQPYYTQTAAATMELLTKQEKLKITDQLIHLFYLMTLKCWFFFFWGGVQLYLYFRVLNDYKLYNFMIRINYFRPIITEAFCIQNGSRYIFSTKPYPISMLIREILLSGFATLCAYIYKCSCER